MRAASRWEEVLCPVSGSEHLYCVCVVNKTVEMEIKMLKRV